MLWPKSVQLQSECHWEVCSRGLVCLEMNDDRRQYSESVLRGLAAAGEERPDQDGCRHRTRSLCLQAVTGSFIRTFPKRPVNQTHAEARLIHSFEGVS